MRRSALIMALCFVLPGLAHAQPPRNAEARGRLLVEKNCAMCHAVGPSGASPFTPAPPFRELGQRYNIENLAEALAEGLLTGHPAMPEFRFSPAQVDDIIHYLRSIQTNRSAATPPSLKRRTG